MCYQFVVHSINLERWFADETLVDDCPYAPEVCLGVVVLGHDDLWGLREDRTQVKIQSRESYATYC